MAIDIRATITDMNKSNKQFIKKVSSGSQHWVGDGFFVKNFFPSNDLNKEIDPFLLLDYAAPRFFEPGIQPHGVGEHPHRGFETVTIVYQGKVAHRDSAGHSGVISPGDVQWMTAGSGVVHEEMHEKDFASEGGIVEMVQLWVNLPRQHKMTSPHYQTLLNAQIPEIEFENGGGYLRVIAGEYENYRGPAKTHTPINLYDVFLKAGVNARLRFSHHSNLGIFILHGALRINNQQNINGTYFIVLSASGEGVDIGANADTRFLVLNGEPINEPIARQGPFVMNDSGEIQQAILDFQSGKMGRLS